MVATAAVDLATVLGATNTLNQLVDSNVESRVLVPRAGFRAVEVGFMKDF